MQWIRENLFLACLTGVLVVCFGAAFTVRSGQDAAFRDEDMAPRDETAYNIGRLRNSKPVNKDWLAKAKGRLDGIRRQRDRIVKDAADWNRKNYSVLKLKATAAGATETIPAFPYDSAVYQMKDLTSKFTNAYRIVLYGALAKLDLTSWPTDVEIGEESVKIEKDIQAKRKAAIKRVEYAQSRGGTPAPKPPAGGAKPEEAKKPEGVSPEDWDLSRLTDAEVHNMARRNATDELMLAKANSGVMFVSPQTLAMVSDPKLPGGEAGPGELDVIFPKEVWQSSAAPAPKLWEAQLNLWITQDILAAIDATNDQSLNTAGSNRTVPNAAVKLLRGIGIEEQYVITAGAEGDAEVKSVLTQRTTTREYEIIQYEFAVVMKTAYLPTLMQNLMMRGDHSVTNLSIEHLASGPDGMRYYGADPVASVKLAGEVLLRSSWTREIMPIATLRDRLGSVLRPEDEARLKKAGQ